MQEINFVLTVELKLIRVRVGFPGRNNSNSKGIQIHLAKEQSREIPRNLSNSPSEISAKQQREDSSIQARCVA